MDLVPAIDLPDNCVLALGLGAAAAVLDTLGITPDFIASHVDYSLVPVAPRVALGQGSPPPPNTLLRGSMIKLEHRLLNNTECLTNVVRLMKVKQSFGD